MRQNIFLFFLGFIALFILGSCNQDTSLFHENFENDIVQNQVNTLLNVEPCGQTYTLCAGQNNSYGEVFVYNDAENLYVSYISTVVMMELHVWVGANYADAPGKNNPALGKFPYKVEDLYDYSYTFTIPLDEVDADGIGCYAIIAHAAFEDGETGYASDACPIEGRVWKNWAQFVTYCLQDPCFGEVDECETGFAYDDELAICFDEIAGLKPNRWGWVLGPLVEGTYTFPIYAGAAQCDLNKGNHVGEAYVILENGTIAVDFDIKAGYELQEYHINVSCELTPEDLAPGQYNCTDMNCEVPCEETFLILHTVTCN